VQKYSSLLPFFKYIKYGTKQQNGHNVVLTQYAGKGLHVLVVGSIECDDRWIFQ
jgi:hypothetical protein